MALISIAGVEVPVAVDSLSLSTEQVGSTARNTRGFRLLERRREKRVVEFSTVPKSLDEAMLLRSLVLGDGELWTMAATQYGAKGLAITGTGTRAGSSGGNPLSTNGVWQVDAGETMVVPWRMYDQSAVGPASAGLMGATLAGWRYASGVPEYSIFGWSWRATETPTVKRQKVGALGSSGACQADTGGETFSAGASALTVTHPTGAWFGYSNMLLLPWYLPQAQVDQLLEGLALVRHVMPVLPRVLVTSDLWPTTQLSSPAGSNQASLVCHGEVSDEAVVAMARGGAWSTTETSLSVRLTEV